MERRIDQEREQQEKERAARRLLELQRQHELERIRAEYYLKRIREIIRAKKAARRQKREKQDNRTAQNQQTHAQHSRGGGGR